MTAFSTSALRWSCDSRSSEARSAAFTPHRLEIRARMRRPVRPRPRRRRRSRCGERGPRAARGRCRRWSRPGAPRWRTTPRRDTTSSLLDDAAERLLRGIARLLGIAQPGLRDALDAARVALDQHVAASRSPPRARGLRGSRRRGCCGRVDRARGHARSGRRSRDDVRSIRAAIVGDVARPGSSLSSARFGRHASVHRECASTQDLVRGAASEGAARGLHRRRRSPDRRPRPARPHVGRRAR